MTIFEGDFANTSIPSEADRAQTLLDHGVADLAGHPKLSALTHFAAGLCDAPIALVSLVEEHRQWFPAKTGLSVEETPRETSFCAHAMVGRDIMIVKDASVDPRFLDNPLVTGDQGIRFYAGAPLVSDDGVPLGALCIIDRVPRNGLSDLQREGMSVLAASVMEILSAQRSRISAAVDHDEQEERFRILADTMPQMVWSTRPGPNASTGRVSIENRPGQHRARMYLTHRPPHV